MNGVVGGAGAAAAADPAPGATVSTSSAAVAAAATLAATPATPAAPAGGAVAPKGFALGGFGSGFVLGGQGLATETAPLPSASIATVVGGDVLMEATPGDSAMAIDHSASTDTVTGVDAMDS